MANKPGSLKKTLVASDSAAGVLSVLNPEGVDLILTDLFLDVTTKSTAACTLDAGIGASASTLYDTVMDGVDVGTAAGLFDNNTNEGTNGHTSIKWPAAQYLTISKASGAAAGLVGSAYMKYVHA